MQGYKLSKDPIPPLKITNLSKSYGKFKALDNVSVELIKGEVFGFLGPNGAGKSTAIRTILNFMAPTSGEIIIYGMNSIRDSVKVKNKIGYLAGDTALYEDMTGRKLVEYLSKLGKDTDWTYVKTLEKRLNANMNRPISELSKGNRQKVGLIQAFMHKPELIILDEPTSGLDPLMKQVFYDMVLEMRSQGKTIFLSSHDLTEVQKICDRAAFIREGKLISIEDIKKTSSLKFRKYEVTFEAKPKESWFNKLKSTKDIFVDGNRMEINVTGNVSEFISALAKHKPIDIDELETTLEDMFMHYYESKEQ